MFSRGHIHQILANPIYAGRIRHKNLVHDGQHVAIIEPEVWDDVQARLADQAARARGNGNAAEASPLAGKLFDETGDRLTPSHANKKGIRYRYYVSHRLVKQSGAPDHAGWHLPARPLEHAIAAILAAAFGESGFSAHVVRDLSVPEMARVSDAFTALSKVLAAGDDAAVRRTSAILSKATVAPDQLVVAIDAAALASELGLPVDRMIEEALVLERPMQLRRRGVEARLVVGDPRPAIDRTLIGNVARAQGWLATLQSGRSFEEIAGREQCSKSRVQQMIHLAFLAPDVVADVLRGTQPLGLTSEWLKARELPVCWDAQRRLIATL